MLTHFQPMFPFYTPWKHQKNKGFLKFSGGCRKGEFGLKSVKANENDKET